MLVIVNNLNKIKKYEKTKARERYKALYLSTIAHDLRTPLNAISSVNIVLLDRFKDNQEVEGILKISQCSV